MECKDINIRRERRFESISLFIFILCSIDTRMAPSVNCPIAMVILAVWLLTTNLNCCLGSNGINSSPTHLSALDEALHRALSAQDKHNEVDNGKETQRNENKNQGLINTIINHNNKLKHIENKFNLMINNFANSSHVKEVVEKNTELEKLILGAPQPHKSWRELALLSILIGILLVLLYKCTQHFLGPWLLARLQRQLVAVNNERSGSDISKRNQKQTTLSYISEIKASLERNLSEHEQEIERIRKALQHNGSYTTDRSPQEV